MKRKVFLIAAVSAFVIGVLVLLYPVVIRRVNSAQTKLRVDEIIEYLEGTQKYCKTNEAEDALEAESDFGPEESDYRLDTLDREKLEKLYKKFKEYNQDLIENGQSFFDDPFIYEDDAVDLSEYGITDGLAGVLSIPKIDLNLPIYLGATKSNMAQGAAHLNRTSLPIGGESTNTVLAGHTGMVRKIMFDNITKLETGDLVYIINYWDTLEYAVREVKIVEPNTYSSICIENGSDLLTLLTCYPYGKNTQRYLVICERR